jgi:hypothetical protein
METPPAAAERRVFHVFSDERVLDACQSALAATLIPILRGDSRVIAGPFPDFMMRLPVAGEIPFSQHQS